MDTLGCESILTYPPWNSLPKNAWRCGGPPIQWQCPGQGNHPLKKSAMSVPLCSCPHQWHMERRPSLSTEHPGDTICDINGPHPSRHVADEISASRICRCRASSLRSFCMACLTRANLWSWLSPGSTCVTGAVSGQASAPHLKRSLRLLIMRSGMLSVSEHLMWAGVCSSSDSVARQKNRFDARAPRAKAGDGAA